MASLSAKLGTVEEMESRKWYSEHLMTVKFPNLVQICSLFVASR